MPLLQVAGSCRASCSTAAILKMGDSSQKWFSNLADHRVPQDASSVPVLCQGCH
jgi:hypothetical protein